MSIEGGVVIGSEFDGRILRTAIPNADSKLEDMKV